MNEKTTKKIGEAQAFANVLCATYTANSAVMDELFGVHAATITETTTAQAAALQSICADAGTTDILEPKVAKTSEKIAKMGDLYVGDEWDDAAEVLEWMSFFVGGAVIHWELIAGAGAALKQTKMHQTATAGVSYYETLLAQLKVAAAAIGETRTH